MALLSVRDVAGRLQLSEYVTREYLKNGKIKGTKLNDRLWRVKEEDLQQFLNECEARTNAYTRIDA